jgi:lipopolysaccharide transport system ATP-binding protein
MTTVAFRAENLSKRYRLGVSIHPTLRETVAEGTRRLFGPRNAATKEVASDFWALRDVSFEVPTGAVLGIVGTNGAGKSTLLKILSRIVRPTTGTVDVRGRMGALLEVGTGFHPDLTGRENIYLNGAVLGMSRADITRRLDAIVDFSGIEPFIDTPVKRYSSGMYLRLAFAVAAHIEPEILIIDEVLAVGDTAFQKKCIGKVGEIAHSGRTVVFVSHHLAQVRQLCNRAIMLADGRVVADGDVSSVVDTYLRHLESLASHDVAARTVRTGEGDIQFAAVEVDSGGGPPRTGAPLTIRFRIRGSTFGIECSFQLFDEHGTAVAWFDTRDIAPSDQVGDDVFECRIDELPLRPGRFRIDAELTSGSGLVEDSVESIAVIDVQDGALDGRPTTYAPELLGSAIIRHRWTRPA